MTSRERTLGASASPRIGRTTRLAAGAPRARAEGQSSHQTIFVAGWRTRAQRWSAVLHATERLQHGPRPLIARNAANRLLICACDASDRTGGSRGAIVGHKLPQNRRQPSLYSTEAGANATLLLRGTSRAADAGRECCIHETGGHLRGRPGALVHFCSEAVADWSASDGQVAAREQTGSLPRALVSAQAGRLCAEPGVR